ncbi:hypothetical protein [Acaryochloris sp. IP29b_bin.137]|uniref:hypothetical protein n=1 Tax=Acaryochloris sp. IP29b_bin.137 TaxID=2969217 RepID=UPI00261B2913|nr:hypothetical protein [Acaryochloris sp. IP29b_bin.137]
MPVFFVTLGVWYLISGSGFNHWNSNQCSPIIDGSPTASGFRLRGQELGCTFDEANYRTSIQKWLSKRPINATPLEGMYLGRAINYPWISKYLARTAIQSKDWDLEKGTSHDGHPYRLIESFLIDQEFRHRLDAPFADTPYTVNRVSVEKVLIDDASMVLDQYKRGAGKVPYDALLWVDLIERQK